MARYYLVTDPPSERKEFASLYDAYIAVGAWLDNIRRLHIQSRRDPNSGRWINTHSDGKQTQVWVENEQQVIVKD